MALMDPPPPSPDRVAEAAGRWWATSDSRLVSALNVLGSAAIRRVVPGGERAYRAVGRWQAAVHRGDAVECPLCGSTFRHFMAWRDGRGNVQCWRCRSHPRHRTLWFFLTEARPDLLDGATDLLHFAPEGALEERLRARLPGYVTCDLDPAIGDLTIDVTDIDLPDESFDGVICSHVLEHVEDDRSAMRELRRVVRPGGWVIVSVPIDRSRPRSLEDPSVVTPEDRLRHYWQEDHVRLYGLDIFERLRDAGFEVEDERVEDWADPEAIARYGLGGNLLLCHRPVESPA